LEEQIPWYRLITFRRRHYANLDIQGCHLHR
jgi:hypothetical protein